MKLSQKPEEYQWYVNDYFEDARFDHLSLVEFKNLIFDLTDKNLSVADLEKKFPRKYPCPFNNTVTCEMSIPCNTCFNWRQRFKSKAEEE